MHDFLNLHSAAFDEINEVCVFASFEYCLARYKSYIFKASYYLLLNDSALECNLWNFIFDELHIFWINC
jgi:hypothetical protein